MMQHGAVPEPLTLMSRVRLDGPDAIMVRQSLGSTIVKPP